MEHLTFFFDGVDNAPSDAFTKDPLFENKIIDALRQYLQAEESLSLARASEVIIRLLPDPPAPGGRSQGLTSFWHLCIDAAEQIPHKHACHMKLARLIIALRHSPKTSFTAISKSWDDRFTLELHLLGETTRDVYNPAYSIEDREGTSTPEHGQRWINTNALYAHLYALNGGMLSVYCTWTMRDAFMSTPSTDYAAMDCHISAAAQWILVSGQNILRTILTSPQKDEKEKEHDMLGPIEPWTLSDWRRWKTGFVHAANEENLSGETRGLARRSADLMNALEAVLVVE